MKTAKFTTTIFKSGNNTGIEVPEDVIEEFCAGKKPPVIVTLKNYSYKSTVAVMGGKYLIPLAKEHRKNANVAGGDVMEIFLQLDEQPRTFDIPDDFKALLEGSQAASARSGAMQRSLPAHRAPQPAYRGGWIAVR